MDKEDVVYVCTHTHTHPSGILKKMKVLLTQSCPGLCHSMDYSLPGSFVQRILQARILEWVPMSFSIQWNTAAAAAAKSLQSCPTLCDPTDGSPPGSPSLGFSKQEHWSGLPFPSPVHESEK